MRLLLLRLTSWNGASWDSAVCCDRCRFGAFTVPSLSSEMTKSEEFWIDSELVRLDLGFCVHSSRARREREDGLLCCFAADLVIRSVTVVTWVVVGFSCMLLLLISPSEVCISISFSVVDELDDGDGSFADEGGMTP